MHSKGAVGAHPESWSHTLGFCLGPWTLELCLPLPDSLSQVPLNRWLLRGLIFPSRQCRLPSGGFRLNTRCFFLVGSREPWAIPHAGSVWSAVGTHISTVGSSRLPWATVTSRVTGSHARAKKDKMRPVWGPRCRAMADSCSVSSFVADVLTLPGQCLGKPQV